MLLIESALIVPALLLAFLAPHLGLSFFVQVEQRLARLAKRRVLAVCMVGATALGLRLALLSVLPIPEPVIHDEFSYLLAADTFSHGRLANSTHPMWIHFETFHVNQKPTYVSMYYPAQGLFLALGQVALGHPYWGVWFSTGLMCAAICWMLQGWLPPLWALLGGLLAVMRLGTFSYWMNSYWGGSVAALGGALVLGALPRIMRHQRVRDAVLMAIGFGLLANSRPYEGLFFSLPVLVALLLWMRRTAPFQRIVLRTILPLVLLCVAFLTAMGYYFWRTTGSPLRTPFQVNTATYNPVPYFPWQKVKAEPEYHHPEMRAFYLTWWMNQYSLARSHPLVLLLLRTLTLWSFFLGPLLTVPFLAACFVVPYGLSFRSLRPGTQLLSLVCFVVYIGASLPVFYNAHYFAPVTCAIVALVSITMSKLRRWKLRNKPVGTALVRYVLVIALLLVFIRALDPTFPVTKNPVSWVSADVYDSARGRLLVELLNKSGTHLVIVRYRPDHNPVSEWVYNKADIDGEKIVWARDMGAERNRELIDYFRGRIVWLVEPDENPIRFSAYNEVSAQIADK